MRDILNCLSALCNIPTETTKRLLSSSLLETMQRDYDAIATQTEISAVHTPQVEHFPYGNRMRPSSLPFAEVANVNALKTIGDPGASSIANNLVKSTITGHEDSSRKSTFDKESNGQELGKKSPLSTPAQAPSSPSQLSSPTPLTMNKKDPSSTADTTSVNC